MGNEYIGISWKEVFGIKYSMLQAPTVPAYIPGEDLKFFGEHNYNPKGVTGLDSTVKFGKYPRGIRARRAASKIATMRNPFASGGKADSRPLAAHQPTKNHSSTLRQVGMRQGAMQAVGEVTLMASTRTFNKSLNHRLWRTIQGMQSEITVGIKKYGGVLIVGRINMMPTVNPESGTRQMFFYDAYLSRGGKSIDEVTQKRPDFVGPRASGQPQNTPQFPPPKPWKPPHNYMVLGEYLVFATSVGNKNNFKRR